MAYLRVRLLHEFLRYLVQAKNGQAPKSIRSDIHEQATKLVSGLLSKLVLPNLMDPTSALTFL